MATQNEPADPVAVGIIPTAKQSVSDLFKWKQRVVVTNDFGETTTEWQQPAKLKNPFSLMAQLSAMNWLFFIVGLLAWVADAFDFHALSIQTVKLSDYYGRSKSDITSAITLTLLLRSVGAFFFGIAGDAFGRKWPMVINMFILGLLQIATIYCPTFTSFLAVRSLFGIFMGGVYGNAVAMALENCPTTARGLMSGVLQAGYSIGYVLAACCNLGVGGATDSWKIIFWVGAGLSIGVGLLRAAFPESKQFLERKKAGHKSVPAGVLWREVTAMLKQQWKMCIYCIILMTWFNYYSHTSQDSYTTFMLVEKELSNAAASRASIWMKAGAVFGGVTVGYISQFFGRRRAIIVSAIVSMCLIPAWILPHGETQLSISGFVMQFFVQGAWGVIPIHLNELSPPAFRSSFPGLTYQLGNMISSPSAQIVNILSEGNSITSFTGKRVNAYGPVMGIATAIIAAGIAVTAALGPERRGRDLGTAVVAAPVTDVKTVDDDEEYELGVDNKTPAAVHVEKS